jgi:hypothetical protein
MFRDKRPEDYNRDPYQVAAERGLEVVLVPPHVISLDIDDDVNWRERVAFANEMLFCELESFVTDSVGGQGKHVYLKQLIPGFPQTEKEKIAIQMALGSDYKRELFCLARALKLYKPDETVPPNLVMFETKDNAASVMQWMNTNQGAVATDGEPF